MSSCDLIDVATQIAMDEGYRQYPYTDTVGVLTIGYGRNLSTNGVSVSEALGMLHADIQNTVVGLDAKLPDWRTLDGVRQGVVINMAFNLGVSGLLGFPRLLAALKLHDYETASREMLSSLWAQQVGTRAKRLAQEMRTGAV